jgi:predicted ArsR family transcriptional regulator
MTGLPGGPQPADTGRSWTFLTNHAHVLICLATEPDLRVRDLAARVGITERAAQRILAELDEAGYVERGRVGRRTHYELRLDRPMRHPAESMHSVGELVRAITR